MANFNECQDFESALVAMRVAVSDKPRFKDACNNWATTGTCRFGDKCKFSHGNDRTDTRNTSGVTSRRARQSLFQTALKQSQDRPVDKTKCFAKEVL